MQAACFCLCPAATLTLHCCTPARLLDLPPLRRAVPLQRWKWDAMHREVPGVEAHWIADQTHAFCVSTKQSGGGLRLKLVESGSTIQRATELLCRDGSGPTHEHVRAFLERMTALFLPAEELAARIAPIVEAALPQPKL